MAIPKKTLFDTGKKTEGGINIFGANLDNLNQYNTDNKALFESGKYKVKYVSRDKLKDNEENTFTITNITFLKKSIEKLGQLQPLVVVPEYKDNKQTGTYIIKSGSRRFASINKICEEAIKEEDTKKYERFNEVLILILPHGATEKEIKEVITETNTTSRQISISDLFRNFDIVFAKKEDGSYENIPAGESKYTVGAKLLQDMGFSYSPASIKDYLTIYTAHNKTISSYLDKGFISKRDALVIARLDESTQDEVMNNIKDMDKDELKLYIKKINKSVKENKKKEVKYIRGVDFLSNIEKVSKKITKISYKDCSFVFTDNVQKDKCLSEIDEMQKYLDDLKLQLNNSYEIEEN